MANKVTYHNLHESLIGKMILVEGGTFQMGPKDGETPIRNVTVSSFYMAETPVTQAQWMAVMGNNPSRHQGDDLPVETVSWDDAQVFLEKLNEITGQHYRLPTESEWEYAARGGQRSRGYPYAGSKYLGLVGYNKNTHLTTHPVKSKKPNELGFYDMSGNVWEWCKDWYEPVLNGHATNPQGPDEGIYRVFRGGSYCCEAPRCRTTYRSYGMPVGRALWLGFRIAHG